jgi:hypothetical protein
MASLSDSSLSYDLKIDKIWNDFDKICFAIGLLSEDKERHPEVSENSNEKMEEIEKMIDIPNFKFSSLSAPSEGNTNACAYAICIYVDNHSFS